MTASDHDNGTPGDPIRGLPAPLHRAAHHAARFLEGLEERPVSPAASLRSLRASLVRPLPDRGPDAAAVIDELARAADPGLVASAGGRYHGFVVGGSLPVATAADWLTSAWDQNASFYVASPAAAVIEEAVGAWLAELLGLPSSASFGFTTGAQSANLVALAAARHRVLARVGWDVDARGVRGAPRVAVLGSEGRHVSIDRALRILGLGADAMVAVPADKQGAMDGAALARTVEQLGGTPMIVCTQAGNVNTGAADPFARIMDVVADRNVWVHVDGAFGLWAAASGQLAHLVAGAERADSWAVDAHKWLNVPHDCAAVFVRDVDAHRASTGIAASYAPVSDSRDPSAWVVEFSRRARAVPAYAALRHLGRRGVEELVDRCCRHARTFAEGLGAIPGIQVLNDVVLNQVLWRVHDDDGATRAVLGRLQASGETWMGPTRWRDVDAIRLSVSGWSTTEQDVQRTLAAVRAAVSSATGG